MRGVNKVTLIGNLGKDPEIQYLEGNIAVAKFPLATTESFKDRSGQMLSQTEWHTVVLWRGLAELALRFLHKGSLVYIEGRLRTRHWEDKEHNKRSATEVVGENLVMLDKRKDSDTYVAPSLDGTNNLSQFPSPDSLPEYGEEGKSDGMSSTIPDENLPF
ncbi:MAG: single-stranded DNA-binding protein [Bacteroidetes bacterium]|nr:single-stranded DNA-binding protein [Bacteroidota bacterium]MBS1629439.1 single-stranded DNA-binding protein [Bacteroidota bacterium]